MTNPRESTSAPKSLPVRHGRGPDGREFFSVTWPDGTRTTWFPDHDRPTSEVHLWRAPGFSVKVGEIREGDHNTQNVKIAFVPRNRADRSRR